MNHSSPTPASASSLPAGKITRKQLAAHCGLCVRTIDELTRSGVLGHYRIGKSVRYDLAEVEAALRERFHVSAAQGREGRSPSPASAATFSPSSSASHSSSPQRRSRSQWKPGRATAASIPTPPAA